MTVRRMLAATAVLMMVFASQVDAAHAAEERRVMHHATGSFEVKVTPAEATPFEKDAGLARYTLEKTLHGDLQGSAHGEMLSTFVPESGAMMYVAVDHVTGTLDGRAGSFTLLHQATMLKGDAASAKMTIVIGAASGTGQLKGIAGTFVITIDAAGKHTYQLDYTLPGA